MAINQNSDCDCDCALAGVCVQGAAGHELQSRGQVTVSETSQGFTKAQRGSSAPRAGSVWIQVLGHVGGLHLHGDTHCCLHRPTIEAYGVVCRFTCTTSVLEKNRTCLPYWIQWFKKLTQNSVFVVVVCVAVAQHRHCCATPTVQKSDTRSSNDLPFPRLTVHDELLASAVSSLCSVFTSSHVYTLWVRAVCVPRGFDGMSHVVTTLSSARLTSGCLWSRLAKCVSGLAGDAVAAGPICDCWWDGVAE